MATESVEPVKKGCFACGQTVTWDAERGWLHPWEVRD